MDEFYRQLAGLLRHDPGHRGLAPVAPEPDLKGLTAALMGSSRVVVTTGFPILSVRVGETDGPPGAANIARALCALGKQVWLVTGPLSAGLVEAARDIHAPAAHVRAVALEGARAQCGATLTEARPDCVVAIERPGKHGGHYYNGKGLNIDALVADTDSLFEAHGAAVTVGIGDGGNELGMGALRRIVEQAVPGGADIAADLGCDYPLAAGVSNWWGWGVAALLSVASGRMLLPTDEEETALLRAVVAAGAVDGVTGRREATVDGLSLEENLGVLRRIRQITEEAIA